MLEIKMLKSHIISLPEFYIITFSWWLKDVWNLLHKINKNKTGKKVRINIFQLWKLTKNVQQPKDHLIKKNGSY